MGEKPTKPPIGNHQRSSGWVTTKVAAAALGVTPRTIRTYIYEGELEGKIEQEGINKRFLVSIASLDELQVRRETEGKFRYKGLSFRTEEILGDMAKVVIFCARPRTSNTPGPFRRCKGRPVYFRKMLSARGEGSRRTASLTPTHKQELSADCLWVYS
jgi:hypothetical protein